MKYIISGSVYMDDDETESDFKKIEINETIESSGISISDVFTEFFEDNAGIYYFFGALKYMACDLSSAIWVDAENDISIKIKKNW